MNSRPTQPARLLDTSRLLPPRDGGRGTARQVTAPARRPQPQPDRWTPQDLDLRLRAPPSSSCAARRRLGFSSRAGAPPSPAPPSVATPARPQPRAIRSPARPATSLRKRGSTKYSIGLYAVQCHKCYKWSTVPKEEFFTLRENYTKDPRFCSRRPDCSCEDVADIEYDSSSHIWVLDNPNIPKPPPGTERQVIMRSDYSKMDIYYVMPNGELARCAGDVDKFLEANPEYKNRMSASDFSFAPLKVVEETVSHNSAWKAAKAKKQKAEAPK